MEVYSGIFKNSRFLGVTEKKWPLSTVEQEKGKIPMPCHSSASLSGLHVFSHIAAVGSMNEWTSGQPNKCTLNL